MKTIAPPGALATSIALLAILLLTLGVSWAALDGPFLFDDFRNLQNLAILGGNPDWNSLATYMAQYKSEPGRPLSMLSFVINDATWPSEPWIFKYTNLQLHLLTGVVVFGLARSLARLQASDRRAKLAALLATAAWLLHPMQLSTSMLVVQRMTQLSALFVFAGMWGYVALASRASTPFRAVGAIAILGLGSVLAVLCKETGVLAPLLAVVVNATLLRRAIDRLPPANRLILHWGTRLPVLLLLAAIAWRWSSLTWYGNRDFSMGERLLTQGRVLCNYVYQILVPNLRGGGIYHDDFVVSRNVLQPWSTLPAFLLVAGTAVAALRLRSRYPLFAFAVLWFLGGHLLESSVFPLELYFLHRNYLPMFGPLFALALSVASRQGPRRRFALALACLWIAFAGWLTWVQAPVWGDARKLTAIWTIEHPMSPRAVQQRADYIARHESPLSAAGTILDAYDRGVRGWDFPLQALNLACATRNDALAARAWPLVAASLVSARYDPALLVTTRKLRMQAQQRACPTIMTTERWLAITDSLLANPGYANPGARKYLHVERGHLFRDRRDLNATMAELEAAWETDHSPDIARLTAATLASAGLHEEAGQWADKARDYRAKGFRGWLLSNDARQQD